MKINEFNLIQAGRVCRDYLAREVNIND